MSDTSFRHQAWTRLEPRLRDSTTIDSYLQAAADMTAEMIEVAGSYSLSISLYGKPSPSAAATARRGRLTRSSSTPRTGPASRRCGPARSPAPSTWRRNDAGQRGQR